MTERTVRLFVVATSIAALALALLVLNGEPVEAQGSLNSFEQQVFDLVNQYRAQNGVAALNLDMRLVTAARNHNAAMIQTGVFSHQVPGELPVCASGANNDRLDLVGYGWTTCGENIAAGQTTPQQVMNDWMNSAGHRANILASVYRDIGVGYTTGGAYGHYWTQDFGAPSGPPLPTPTRTNTRTNTPVVQASATRTPTRTPTRTNTPLVQPSPTRTPTRTNTPLVQPSPTRTPTRTNTPGPSQTQLDGVTTGVFRPSNGLIYLRNSNTSGVADVSFVYGIAGDKPVSGDWNGDGIDSIGIYRGNAFYLRNSNTSGSADLAFAFGAAGDRPVVGDWDGNTTTTVGVYRNGAVFLRNSNGSGSPDLVFSYGTTGDIPIAGDWNGDGIDTIGIFRPSTASFYLRNSNTSGPADIAFLFGIGSDVPVVGDWNGDNITTVGVFRNGFFFLKNSHTGGSPDITFMLGTTGDQPIAGDWDNKP